MMLSLKMRTGLSMRRMSCEWVCGVCGIEGDVNDATILHGAERYMYRGISF
jgi:hypothetical protein